MFGASNSKSEKLHIFIFFSSLPVHESYQDVLAGTWLQVSGSFMDVYAHKFNNHPKNFFDWDMSSGSYLAKEYISKSIQKDVPENFQNVGRFWGNSRNMKPEFVTIEPEKLETSIAAGVVSAVRTLTKRYCQRTLELKKLFAKNRREKNQTVGKPGRISKPNPRKKIRSYSLPAMAGLFMILAHANIGAQFNIF